MLLILSVLLAHSACALRLRDHVVLHKTSPTPPKYQYDTEYFKVPIDHFAFTNTHQFDLRYFINLQSYKPGGPILFYTGNEGGLESFAENTGLMWDIAPEFNAAVVFAEHRFYGKTQPFKNESYKSIENLGYLTSEQALADFAALVQYLKEERIPAASNSPVIAFGGSYGGMLSAWMRIKYPHIIDGAIAASAPVFWFVDSDLPDDTYDFIVTRAFTDSGCNRKAIEKSWISLENLAKTDEGRQTLNKLFKLDPKSLIKSQENINFLKGYIREAMEAMAMVNYPYPTSFLSSLPGWPVKEACKFATTVPTSDEQAAEQLYQIVNLYYNYTGNLKTLCADASKCDSAYGSLGDPLGWPFQTCTEMTMPQCASGYPNDFFWKDCPFTIENYTNYCVNTFSSIGYNASYLRPRTASRNYGAKSLPTASNIVFSNGYLDPWSGGGYAKEHRVDGSVISIILKQGAHHYDLRANHPDDTDEVRLARFIEKSAIKTWIRSKNKKARGKSL